MATPESVAAVVRPINPEGVEHGPWNEQHGHLPQDADRQLRQTLAQLIIARDVATDTGNTASLERILDAIGRVSGELASRRRRRQTYGGGR